MPRLEHVQAPCRVGVRSAHLGHRLRRAEVLVVPDELRECCCGGGGGVGGGGDNGAGGNSSSSSSESSSTCETSAVDAPTDGVRPRAANPACIPLALSAHSASDRLSAMISCEMMPGLSGAPPSSSACCCAASASRASTWRSARRGSFARRHACTVGSVGIVAGGRGGGGAATAAAAADGHAPARRARS